MQALLIRMTGFVIRIAPIGVYALLYPVLVKSMEGLVMPYVYMVVCCLPILHGAADRQSQEEYGYPRRSD